MLTVLTPCILSWGTKADNHQDYLLVTRQLGHREAKPGTVSSVAGTARVRGETEARRLGVATTKATRARSGSSNGVTTRAKAKPE